MGRWFFLFLFFSILACSSRREEPFRKAARFEWLPETKSVSPLNKNSPLPKSERGEPDFVKVEVFRKSETDTLYGDVISHSKDVPFGDSSGRTTNAHETTHGINSFLRNSYSSQVKKKMNGFYVLQGRGVILEEPSLRMRDVHEFVPKNLRSYRWRLYMESQLKDWDDTPTYIFDEWVAYVNGGAVAVDDIKKQKRKGGWTDGVSGCCDFSIYAIALGMAVKQKDARYWNANDQFKNFLVWELRLAEEIFLEGRVLKEVKWKTQDELLLQFLTSEEAKAMRDFCRTELDGVWIDIDPESIRKTP
jgi:hypothetical protein